MELRNLIGFVAVANHLHFSRAAEQLHLAQPALSQQIATLEKELGVKLFHRSTRSVTLSEAGARLLPVAKRIVEDVETARLIVHADDGVVGKIALGFAGMTANNVIPQLTRSVKAAHPGIRIALNGQMYSGEVAQYVVEGELDLGLVKLPVRNQQLGSYVVDSEQFVAVLPPEHLLAWRAEIDLEDLRDSPFVTFPGTGGSSVRLAQFRLTREAGFAPHVVQEAEDALTIMHLVAAGIGVTLMPQTVASMHQLGVAVIPLSGDHPPIESALVWRRNDKSVALRAVLEIARSIAPAS